MKKLTMIDVFSIALGSIIGWGAFMLPGDKFLPEAGIINTLLGLLLGAVAILIIENSFKYMVSTHFEDGGGFSFTYKRLGKQHGFICGWFLSLAYLSIVPLNATAFPLVIDKVLNGSLKVLELYQINGNPVYLGEVLVSTVVILIFAFINIRGIKNAGKIQSYMTLFLVGIVMLIVGAMTFETRASISSIAYISEYEFDFYEVFAIFSITPWAFIGFDAISQLVNEFSFSRSKASQLSIFAILFGLFVYVAMTFITGLIYPQGELGHLNWATGEAVHTTLGYLPFLLLCLALAFAVCSGVNGFFVATSKLLGSMNDYGVLPFGVNANRHVLLFITVISLIAPWFGREVLSTIVDMSSIGAAIVYGYICFITVKDAPLRKDKILGSMGCVISIVFILLLLVPNSPGVLDATAKTALGVWALIGVGYYLRAMKK